MKNATLAFAACAFAIAIGCGSGALAQSNFGLKNDIAGTVQTPLQNATGDLAAKPKENKEGLFDDCNSSDCNIESYTTDCNVVHGGLSSEPGGGISCNAGPQHRP